MSESSEPTSATDEPTPSPARKPRRRRRRFLRFLVILAIVFIVVIAAIQVVLWSDIPKNLVLAALQKTLGVKVEAKAVQTGWWGNTRVDDVTMTIPLEDQPFIKTGVIHVKHSSLLSLVFFGLELKSLDIETPEVHLRQSPAGRWNVVELAQGLGGGCSAGGGGVAERPKLPAIRIRDAVLHVTDNQNRTNKVGPLTVTGQPSETSPDLVWDFAIDAPRQLAISGRVATGGDWRHQVKIDVQDIRPLLSPFIPNAPDVRMLARWEGRAGDGVEGRLSIDQLTANGQSAKGDLALSTAGGKVTASPENLELLDAAGKAIATAVGGRVMYDASGIKVSELVVRGAGIDLIANAAFVPATFSGELSANWTASAAPSAVRHAGTVAASIARTYDNRIEARAAIDSNGHLTGTPARRWSGRVEVTAAGPDLDELSISS